jgi:hypothetical protein
VRELRGEYLDEVDGRLLPVWMAIVIITGWLTLVTIVQLESQGIQPEQARGLINAMIALMGFFVLVPIVTPAARVLLKRRFA